MKPGCRLQSYQMHKMRTCMDDLIRELDGLTEQILARLSNTSFEDIEKFVEERQEVVDKLAELVETSLVSIDQKHEIQRILTYDAEILARMNALKQEAQNFLHKRGQAKMQRNAYEAAYTPDSILMDRKK